MPWIDVEEPYAKPPRVAPTNASLQFSGDLDIDRGLAELVGVSVDVSGDPGLDLDFTDCVELHITDSEVRGLTIGDGLTDGIELHRSVLRECDFSQAVVRTLRSSRVESCKLIGTDFSGGSIVDTVFEHCVFRYVNLRMATLTRVRFVGCEFHDIDGYELSATDVDLGDSRLDEVNLDKLSATRVDLRAAEIVSLTAACQLGGCLFTEHQLPALAYSLAAAVGLDIEKPSDGVE